MNPTPTPITGGKRCLICDKHKPASEFYKSRFGINGLHSYCKICFRDRQNSRTLRRLKAFPTSPSNDLEQWKNLSKRLAEALQATREDLVTVVRSEFETPRNPEPEKDYPSVAKSDEALAAWKEAANV